MITRSFILNTEHIAAFTENYNKLIQSGQYQYINESMPLSQAIEELIAKISSVTENFAFCFEVGTAIVYHSSAAKIAILRHGHRRKVTIVAESSFWDTIPTDIEDHNLSKLLVKKGFIDKSSVKTQNLDFNLVSVTSNWNL